MFKLFPLNHFIHFILVFCLLISFLLLTLLPKDALAVFSKQTQNQTQNQNFNRKSYKTPYQTYQTDQTNQTDQKRQFQKQHSRSKPKSESSSSKMSVSEGNRNATPLINNRPSVSNQKSEEIKLKKLKQLEKFFQRKEPLRYLPVQIGGRTKPFDSFARESLKFIYGKKKYKNQEATTIILTWMMIPGLWEKMDLIRINHNQVKKDLDLDVKKARFSPSLLRQKEKLGLLIQELRNKKDKKEKLDSYFEAIERLGNKMNLFYAISLQSYLPIVPSKNDSTWKSIPELKGHLKNSFNQVRKSFVQGLVRSPKLNQLSNQINQMKQTQNQTQKQTQSQTHRTRKSSPLNRTQTSSNITTRDDSSNDDTSNEETSNEETSKTSKKIPQSQETFPPLNEALAQFAYQAMNENVSAYANLMKIKTEVFYNTLSPFKLSWIFYLLALVSFFLSFLFKKEKMIKKSVQKTFFYRFGLSFLASAFLIHSIGIILRVYISGRPPVTNMYETMLWVPWGSVLFGMILELRYKTVLPLLASASVAALCLIVSSMAPTILDPSISPLEAVLRDNFWLVFHVLVICLSYAAFFLSFFLSDILLFFTILDEKKHKTQIKEGVQVVYRSMQVGVLLLLIGIVLGGVWADLSWGRFWGWDPKETWALIALLGYIALLHGRIGGWLKDFGMIVGSITAFSLILMAWYGVNFILGAGLHSYGFSSGGIGFVFTFVAIHAAYILYAIVHRMQKIQTQRI